MIERRYQFREGVSLVVGGPNGVTLVCSRRSCVVALPKIDPGTIACLLRGLSRPTTAKELAQQGGDPEMSPRLAEELVGQLRVAGWLRVELVRRGGNKSGEEPVTAVATMEPRWPRGTATTSGVSDRLSRFTTLIRDGGDIVIDSPLAAATIRLHELRWATAVAAPDLPDFSAEAVELRTMLADAGLLAAGDDEDKFDRAQWSPHELSFHHHSRLRDGVHMGEDFGGSSWARGKFPKPPADHPRWSGSIEALPRWEQNTNDPALSKVVASRRSIRRYDDDHPMDRAGLGAFLDRVGSCTVDADGKRHRLYPAGGAEYEIEIYVLVRLVTGLMPGLYHYDPARHGLRRLPTTINACHVLLKTSIAGLAGGEAPQTLLVLSTRFGRIAWKYRAIAYALTLKHVGVLFESMYLSATALGLAPCAIGTGDSDAFAFATGLDYAFETSVGEFALGSVPSEPQLEMR